MECRLVVYREWPGKASVRICHLPGVGMGEQEVFNHIWREKGIPGRGQSKHSGPEVQTHL